MKRFLKRKLSYGKWKKPSLRWINLIITKIFYLTMWIIVPLLFSHLAWWEILVGFFIMHYTAGVLLGLIFQLAHMVEDAHMPLPDETGTMKNTWAIHQLHTTVNFSTKSRLMNWYTGGLNHQVEHHIFPHISHIHYTNISKIVKETANEFNLPYFEYKTTRKAIKAHFNHLRAMSMKPSIAS